MHYVIGDPERVHLYESITGQQILRLVAGDDMVSVYLTKETLSRLAEVASAYMSLEPEEV